MANLQVLLCGSPEVRQDGQPLTITRRTPRALLFYLASQGGMVGRDQLLSLFWEDQDETAARRRLTDTLSRLRLGLRDPDAVISDIALVGLDFNQVYVDQLEFINLLDQAGRLPWQIPANDPLPKHTHDLLKRAAGLWRSPGFLIGANFPSSVALDEWLTRTTQSMEHQLGRVLDRLAKHAQANGDLEQALHLMRQCLHLDELEEDTNYRILRYLIDLGYHNEAREHFIRYETLLRHELDASPSPRLVDLYRRVRNGRAVPTRVESNPFWKVRPSVQVPFVGRHANLEQLHRAYQTGRAVFIFGESGQGKTRLLQEFAAGIMPPPRLMVTTCRPAEVNLPFQPLVELLRYQIQPEEWLRLPAVWASQLSLLLPELMEMRTDLTRPVLEPSPEAAPGMARGALLEAVRQVFLLVSQDRRLVMCIDDAHWADEASVATMAYLLERAPFNNQALLLVAARWEESNPHLEALLSTLQSTNQAIVMPLVRLEEDDISALASFVFGQSPSSLFTRQLFQKTDGNPFILLESLRSLVEEQTHLDLSTLKKLPVVKSVQNLITARLNKLPARTRTVLEVAAVIGTDFDPEILAQIIELAPMEVAAELGDLNKRFLIEPVDSSPGNYRHRFLHETIRDTLLETINPLRARLLHAQVARALEASALPSDQAAILAEHYELAGDYVPAFDYWLSTGKRARRLLSSSEAAWSFERAASLIERAPQLTDHQIHELFYEWTEIAFEAEDAETIRQINSDLFKLGQERKSPLLIGSAFDGMSDASLIADLFDEGLEYTTQAIKFLEAGDHPFQLMQAHNHRGVFLYMLNRLEESIEAFQDVLSLSVGSRDPRLIRARANAHYQVAVARILVGMPESAQNHALRALADYVELQHFFGQITAYSALALARCFLGKYDQASKDCQTGIELAQRMNARRMLGYLHVYQALTEMSRGNLDATIQNAQQAIQIGEAYHHGEIISAGWRILGDFYFWTSHYRKSVEMYARAVQVSENKFLTVDSQYRLGLAMYMDKKTGPGKKLLAEIIEITEQAGHQMIWVLAKIAELMVLVVEGTWKQVTELHALLAAQVKQRSMPELSLIVDLLLVEKAIQSQEDGSALQIAQECARQAASLGHPWLEMRSLLAVQRIQRKTARLDSSVCPRILNLLEQVEQQASIQPYSRALRAYSKLVRLQLV